MQYRQAVTISDLREIARKKLPRAVFGFIDGAAFDEQTMRENETDFSRIRFAPRFLIDVGQRSQAVTVMGHTYRSPMILGPTGLAGVLWRWGDLQIARHGVERAINMLQQEIDITQALLGVPELSKIDRSALLTSHEPSSVF